MSWICHACCWDIGNCPTKSAAMSRSGSYKWVGLCPSDLHINFYFCEATFKVHGSSGLHYILLEAMKRKKLTFEVFKNKRFQENNLIQVRETIPDVCKAYGIAAALKRVISRSAGIAGCCRCEYVTFGQKHRSTTFLVYGLIQKLYDASTAYRDGFASEVVYQAQLPIYVQLGFGNYHTEVFCHVLNFLAK